MKICLVCSHGGHLTEILQLMEAFDGKDVFFATYHSARDDEVKNHAPAYFTQNIGYNIARLIRASVWAVKILLQEKPDVIFSNGAEIALPFFYFGKMLGIKTIYIEGLFSVVKLSKTGRLVYPITDIFLVQWPQLLEVCGPKARFEGSII